VSSTPQTLFESIGWQVVSLSFFFMFVRLRWTWVDRFILHAMVCGNSHQYDIANMLNQKVEF